MVPALVAREHTRGHEPLAGEGPAAADPESSGVGDRSAGAGKVLDPQLLRNMLDATGDLIYVKDLEGAYLACNRASEKLVGVAEAEQIGKTDFDFFSREFAEAIRAEDRLVMASRLERRVEEWVTYPDGARVLMESLKAPLYGLGGKVVGLVGVSRDVTARKRAEERLARERDFSEQLIRVAPVGIAVYQAETGRCLVANPALCDITGATQAQLACQNFRELASWREAGLLAAAEAALASGRRQQLSAQLRTGSGRVVWALAILSSFDSEEGVHLVLLLKDITDMKVAEAERERMVQELTEALANVKTLSGLLPVCAWCKNVRDDAGYWQRIETYLSEHSDARCTHGMCPDCLAKRFPEDS
jgi:PAS domain S-box-containing protein